MLSLGKFEKMNTHHYKIYGEELEDVFEEKDLGVTIDSELTFGEHIAKKVKVASRIVGLIRRSFSFLDGNSLKYFRCFCSASFRICIICLAPHLFKYVKICWRMYRNEQRSWLMV